MSKYAGDHLEFRHFRHWPDLQKILFFLHLSEIFNQNQTKKSMLPDEMQETFFCDIYYVTMQQQVNRLGYISFLKIGVDKAFNPGGAELYLAKPWRHGLKSS